MRPNSSHHRLRSAGGAHHRHWGRSRRAIGGRWHDGTYQGFDITIAKYVAAKLGYANKQIVFKQVRPENRRSMLDNGQVDMVVASWPITDESSAIVDFAGPYLTTSVGLLVRSDERGRFTNDGRFGG